MQERYGVYVGSDIRDSIFDYIIKVVIHTITYASLTWWHKDKNKSMIRKPSKLQRFTCLGITYDYNVHRSHEVLVGLEMEAQAKLSAYRLKIGSRWAY